MSLNQKLILGLSFRGVSLSIFVNINDPSNFNPSYSSVQLVVTLNGGAQNRLSENTPKISVPQALEQNVKVSKNFSSSVSNSKTNISTPQPGNKSNIFMKVFQSKIVFESISSQKLFCKNLTEFEYF